MKQENLHSKTGARDALITALRQYERNLQGLAYNELPPELHDGIDLDLSQWSLVITDKCLGRIAAKNKGRQNYRNETNLVDDNGAMLAQENIEKSPQKSQRAGIRKSDSNTADMEGTIPKTISSATMRSLNLSGGEKITDLGVKYIAESCTALKVISLENAFQVKDLGLQYLARFCPDLICINLSGCLAISGTGFAILGQHCGRLKTLKLSGCRQVKPWAFMKIFEGCPQLVELDVSYCTLITDQEVKLLSDYCIGLKILNMKECKQVTDVGMLSLSQGSVELTDLNISRSDLVFNITDVSLLALGQSCHNLVSLNLNGCNMITDSGLSWIAKGSTGLQHIDLTNCSRISNGGMRYLGEECKQLRDIILSNLKRVSDVGIRHIADGCCVLEHLNASGVYLLSDGINRDFGFEGIQAIGKSSCSKTMKNLNLHGCFQVSCIALMSISRLKQLERLTLSGCMKLSIKGMTHISASCKNVMFLSLASCGDCVTDSMVEMLASGMPRLSIVNLADCEKVGRRGLRALSGCTELKSLDFSGCIGITDQAILFLCEGNYSPGLHSLFLNRCRNLGDTALTWIADGLQDDIGQVTLIKLALKDTKVTSAAVRAVRDRFRYSSVKKNDSFFGFWPLSRPNDRKIINKHGMISKCAAQIQACVRARREKAVVRRAREEYCRRKVATKLAAFHRGFKARKHVKDMKRTRWQRHVMAIKLQCWFRVKTARKNVQRIRHKRWLIVAPFAATRIQKQWRGNTGRRIAWNAKLYRTRMLQKRENLCILIQSIWRMRISIKVITRLRREQIKRENERNSCASKLQNQWRIYIAKKSLSDLKSIYEALQERRCLAADRIRTCYRKHHFCALLQRKIGYRQMREKKANTIEAWVKEIYARYKYNTEQAKILEERKQRSAIFIQRNFRRRIAYMTVQQMKKDHNHIEALKVEKAVTLRHWWRLCLAKHRAQMRREALWENQKRICKLKNWAATVIAAAWRRKQGCDMAREVSNMKRGWWKQLWSNEDNKPFYYNRATGETRWRKPQELLDLEPRPICSNCNFYDAQVECADCNEFYCHQCWDAVHFGGKRAEHNFRSLYDYYGKRVDYEESAFPSRWPTEVEQSDKFGWQLRVSPFRVPSSQNEDWNYYKDSSTSRIFCHNQRTNETCYAAQHVDGSITLNAPYSGCIEGRETSCSQENFVESYAEDSRSFLSSSAIKSPSPIEPRRHTCLPLITQHQEQVSHCSVYNSP